MSSTGDTTKNRYSGIFDLSALQSRNEYKPSCVERPATKAALFVIAFLLAGGAIASHFTGLGTIAVASFGAGSGVAFTAAIAVSLYARYKARYESIPYATLLDSATPQEDSSQRSEFSLVVSKSINTPKVASNTPKVASWLNEDSSSSDDEFDGSYIQERFAPPLPSDSDEE